MSFIIIFGILTLICFIYWCIMVGYAGIGTAFAPVWFAAFVFFAIVTVAGILDYKRIWHIPTGLKRGFVIFISLCVVFFGVVEGMIVSGMTGRQQDNLDYVIVLGAQVRGTRITNSLRKRLEAAKEYLDENPNTIAIVSGGQGEGEDLSEAQCMYDYLIENGISPERVIMEAESTSTEENIEFSMKLIEENYEGSEPSIGIITNNFHVYRTVKVCEKKGYEVSGIPAESDRILFVNYMVREFFALVQYKISGRI